MSKSKSEADKIELIQLIDNIVAHSGTSSQFLSDCTRDLRAAIRDIEDDDKGRSALDELQHAHGALYAVICAMDDLRDAQGEE